MTGQRDEDENNCPPEEKGNPPPTDGRRTDCKQTINGHKSRGNRAVLICQRAVSRCNSSGTAKTSHFDGARIERGRGRGGREKAKGDSGKKKGLVGNIGERTE